MKILLLTNHFQPEEFRCNDIAFELAKRGHKVKVLTAIPDYPQGHFHKGYSLFSKRVETVNGVKVVRVPIIPRGKGGKLRMVANYASSTFFFINYAIFQALFHKYDCIYIHDTSPAFICLPAVLIKKIRKTPIVLWILDMWPESLVAGGIRSKKVYGFIDKMMRMVYRNCKCIQISSLGFRETLVERGVEDDKISYFPNWSDDAITSGGSIEVDKLPDGFKIVFAGNLGEAQNLENVLYAAKITKGNSNNNIQWIFLGDGRKKPWMENFVAENSLDNVHFLGRRPIEQMPAFFSQADALLVSLNDEPVFNGTLPAKVQAYMSCSKPIIGFMNGEGQTIIKRAECGVCVDANDFEGLASTVELLSASDKTYLESMGRNGYEYYQQEFNREMLMDRVESVIKDAIYDV